MDAVNCNGFVDQQKDEHSNILHFVETINGQQVQSMGKSSGQRITSFQLTYLLDTEDPFSSSFDEILELEEKSIISSPGFLNSISSIEMLHDDIFDEDSLSFNSSAVFEDVSPKEQKQSNKHHVTRSLSSQTDESYREINGSDYVNGPYSSSSVDTGSHLYESESETTSANEGHYVLESPALPVNDGKSRERDNQVHSNTMKTGDGISSEQSSNELKLHFEFDSTNAVPSSPPNQDSKSSIETKDGFADNMKTSEQTDSVSNSDSHKKDSLSLPELKIKTHQKSEFKESVKMTKNDDEKNTMSNNDCIFDSEQYSEINENVISFSVESEVRDDDHTQNEDTETHSKSHLSIHRLNEKDHLGPEVSESSLEKTFYQVVPESSKTSEKQTICPDSTVKLVGSTSSQTLPNKLEDGLEKEINNDENLHKNNQELESLSHKNNDSNIDSIQAIKTTVFNAEDKPKPQIKDYEKDDLTKRSQRKSVSMRSAREQFFLSINVGDKSDISTKSDLSTASSLQKIGITNENEVKTSLPNSVSVDSSIDTDLHESTEVTEVSTSQNHNKHKQVSDISSDISLITDTSKTTSSETIQTPISSENADKEIATAVTSVESESLESYKLQDSNAIGSLAAKTEISEKTDSTELADSMNSCKQVGNKRMKRDGNSIKTSSSKEGNISESIGEQNQIREEIEITQSGNSKHKILMVQRTQNTRREIRTKKKVEEEDTLKSFQNKRAMFENLPKENSKSLNPRLPSGSNELNLQAQPTRMTYSSLYKSTISNFKLSVDHKSVKPPTKKHEYTDACSSKKSIVKSTKSQALSEKKKFEEKLTPEIDVPPPLPPMPINYEPDRPESPPKIEYIRGGNQCLIPRGIKKMSSKNSTFEMRREKELDDILHDLQTTVKKMEEDCFDMPSFGADSQLEKCSDFDGRGLLSSNNFGNSECAV